MRNYYITARDNEQHAQGIPLQLSAEFEKGVLPTEIKISGRGGLLDHPDIIVVVNARYNVPGQTFVSLNMSNETEGFVAELRKVVTEFYDGIVSDERSVL